MTFAESRETEHFEVIKVKEAEVSDLRKELDKLKKSIKIKEKEISYESILPKNILYGRRRT